MLRVFERTCDVPSGRARALIDDVVVAMSEALDDSATAVTDAIYRACGPELTDDLYLATRQSTRANLGLITTLIADGAAPSAFTAPEEALSYARSYVHEGLSFDLLIRAYREGEHAYIKLWLEQLHKRAANANELADSLAYISDWLFAYIGAMNGPLNVVYTAEHERYVRGGVAMRSEEVRAILGGNAVDTQQSSTRLRYRLDGRHLAFVIWREDGTPHPLGGRRMYDEMDRLASEITTSLGASSALLLPIGSIFAGWVGVGGDFEVESALLPKGRDGLRIALGRVARGVEGFRRSHHEALMAKRVGSLSERSSGSALSFGSIALDALLTHDLDEARRFVFSEIGPLMDDSDANRRLAATLEVFLQEESSFVRAARRLGVHENTVAYRVRRAEELLGRRTAERQLELRAALRLAGFVRGDSPIPTELSI